jgi:hypothetical protein
MESTLKECLNGCSEKGNVKFGIRQVLSMTKNSTKPPSLAIQKASDDQASWSKGSAPEVAQREFDLDLHDFRRRT